MRTSEHPAYPIGKLVGSKEPVRGSTTLRLACTHLGSIALSHGLCLGRRQLTILTPSPPSLTRRLCLPSHRLTSLETRQEALSQIRSGTFLPRASSLSQLHSRNRVWSSLASPPRTSARCRPSLEGSRARGRRRPWARDRPWRSSVGRGGGACLHLPSY